MISQTIKINNSLHYVGYSIETTLKSKPTTGVKKVTLELTNGAFGGDHFIYIFPINGLFPTPKVRSTDICNS